MEDITGIFYNYSSLTSLSDISNWNSNKVINISYMLDDCSSLTALSNLSNWNTENIEDISEIILIVLYQNFVDYLYYIGNEGIYLLREKII